MTTWTRTEGPRAPLFCAAVALLLLTGKSSIAQTVDLSMLQRCAALETPELKLACFEAITATEKAPDEQPPDVSVNAVQEIATATVSFEAVDSDAVEREATLTEVNAEPDLINRQAAGDVISEESATASADDIESELLATREEDRREVFKAIVVDVTKGHNRALFFHLFNGHIWRQIEPRRLQYPKGENFEVNISQGLMGEYRLRIGDNGRLVRIRRVR